MARLLAPLWVCLAAGCETGPGTEFFLFNSEEDRLEIEVTAGDELGEPLSIDLNSTTGAVVVGSATATPGSGPVGTEHALRVEVLEAWEDQVTRVAVSADSGSRGTELFELRQDSADYGLWVLDLRSSGEEGEARQDIWTIQLFQEQVVQEPLDTAVAN